MPRPSSEPLRIAWLVYRGNPHCGGQGVYTRYVAREVADMGHHIEVLAGQPWPELVDPDQLVEVPSLDLYRSPDPFRVPHVREFRDTVDMREFAIMCAGRVPRAVGVQRARPAASCRTGATTSTSSTTTRAWAAGSSA